MLKGKIDYYLHAIMKTPKIHAAQIWSSDNRLDHLNLRWFWRNFSNLVYDVGQLKICMAYQGMNMISSFCDGLMYLIYQYDQHSRACLINIKLSTSPFLCGIDGISHIEVISSNCYVRCISFQSEWHWSLGGKLYVHTSHKSFHEKMCINIFAYELVIIKYET